MKKKVFFILLSLLFISPSVSQEMGEDCNSPLFKSTKKEEIFALIRDNERMTRKTLVEITGWSRTTITSIIAELKKEGRIASVRRGSDSFYQVEGDKPPVSQVEQRKEEVFALIRDKERMTRQKLVEITDWSEPTISSTISQLKRDGRILSVGRGPSGFYQAREEGDNLLSWEEQKENEEQQKKQRKEKVFTLIRDKERMTGRKLSEITGWSIRTIDNTISQLKREGRIVRVRRGPNSFYRVPEEGDNPPLSGKEQKENEEQKKQRKEEIFTLIRDNERMTRQKLSEITDWSRSTIDSIISELKQEGRILSVDEGSGGFYQVREEGDSPPLSRKEQKKQRKEEVFTLIRDKERITVKKLIEITGLSGKVIDRTISELKQDGRIVRVRRGQNSFYHVEGDKPPVSRREQKEQRKEEIFTLIRDNKRMTRKKLAEITHWSESTINNTISELKQEGRIISVRRGADSFYHVEGDKPPVSREEQRKEEIFTLIRDNEHMTRKKLIEITHWSAPTIGNTISKLKKEGRIVSVGGGGTDFYHVEGDNLPPSLKEQRKEEIFTLIRDNEHMTRQKLIEITIWPAHTISRTISELKRDGRIVSVGGGGTGFYHVEGDNLPPSLKEQRKEEIFTLIRDNEHMTRKKLIEITHWSAPTISNTISKLKKEGRIVSVGEGLGSFYQVREEGDKPPVSREEQRKEEEEAPLDEKHRKKRFFNLIGEKLQLIRSFFLSQ